MYLYQACWLGFWVTAWIVVVICQLTVVESWLRRAHPGRVLIRAPLSIAHGIFGLLAFFASQAHLNILTTGSYRHGPFGEPLVTLAGGILCLALPWFGLLRKTDGSWFGAADGKK